MRKRVWEPFSEEAYPRGARSFTDDTQRGRVAFNRSAGARNLVG